MSDGLPPGERTSGSTIIPGTEAVVAEDPNIAPPNVTPQPSNPADAALAQVQDIPADEFERNQQMEKNELVQKKNFAAAQRAAAERAAEEGVSALKLRSNPIRFNPPIIRFASGAKNIPSPKDRRLVFTDASQNQRVVRKGFVVPDISHAQNDWYSGSVEGNDTVDLSGLNYPFEGANTKKGAVVYGFKFMYNPAVLDFGISSTDNVNLGYIASGRSTAMPIGATQTGSGISLSFPITRIDDISLIRSQTYSVRNEHYQRALDKWNEGGQVGDKPKSSQPITSYLLDNLKWAYGRKGSKVVTQEDLREIMERGTMYDLEFLFRTVLGRRWRTLYRGYTADVGLAFGVPLKLVLSSTMIYRVRLTNISFSHKSFTPDMIPMYTDVSLTFDRIPDVVAFK